MTKQNAINPTVSWIIPTLQNSWVNYGGGFLPASYSLNSIGQVQFAGVIKSGVSGIIFTLQTGCRPKAYKGFRLLASDLQAYALVYPSGDVNLVIPTNDNTYVYLDNVLFPIY